MAAFRPSDVSHQARFPGGTLSSHRAAEGLGWHSVLASTAMLAQPLPTGAQATGYLPHAH